MISIDKLDKPNWWRTTFQLQGSVFQMILPRILFFCGLTATFCVLQGFGRPLYVEKLADLNSSVIYNFILGLLLVFRTNTSYDRFWEGRKAWGALVVNIRNLSREIQLGVTEPPGSNPADKQAAMRLLSAFAIATKLELRGEPANQELKELVTPEQAQQLDQAKNLPLVILFWIRRYLQQQANLGNVPSSVLADATTMLNNLGEGVSGCERIITTPIPVSYRIYLKRLILIFCLSLPCRLVPALGWWSLPIVMVVSFVLMGVEEVGRELENPFGYGLNDLPLNDICDGIVAAVESTIALGTAPESVSESVPDSV